VYNQQEIVTPRSAGISDSAKANTARFWWGLLLDSSFLFGNTWLCMPNPQSRVPAIKSLT